MLLWEPGSQDVNDVDLFLDSKFSPGLDWGFISDDTKF